MDRAARYEEATSPTKREREPDPAELPLAARLALFERNAGAAPVPLPKVPFGTSLPTKQQQTSGAKRVESKKPSPRKPAVQHYPGLCWQKIICNQFLCRRILLLKVQICLA